MSVLIELFLSLFRDLATASALGTGGWDGAAHFRTSRVLSAELFPAAAVYVERERPPTEVGEAASRGCQVSRGMRREKKR